MILEHLYSFLIYDEQERFGVGSALYRLWGEFGKRQPPSCVTLDESDTGEKPIMHCVSK